jgi:hypothetical protein
LTIGKKEAGVGYPKVIVEGMDGTGKTNLVQHINRNTLLPLRPRACTSDGGPIDTLMEWVENYLKDDMGGIYDRHPLISEFIYGPAIRGYAHKAFTDDAVKLSRLFGEFYFQKPIIIYCDPGWFATYQNLLKNHNAADSDHLKGVVKNAALLYDLYVAQRARDYHKPNVYHWDYQAPTNYGVILNAILEGISE